MPLKLPARDNQARNGMIIIVQDPEPVASLSFATQWLYKFRHLQSNPHFKLGILAGGAVLAFISIGGAILLSRVSRRRRRLPRRNNQLPGTIPLQSIQKYPGIRNIGNSCYLNCVVQALSSVRLPSLPPTSFNNSLLRLLLAVNTPNIETLDASPLVATMGGILSKDQQDAHELLQAMLSVLSRSIRRTLLPTSFGLDSLSASMQDSLCPRGLLPPGGIIDGTLPWEGWQANCIRCAACGKSSSSGTQIHTFSMLVVSPADSFESAFRKSYQPDPLPDYLCACNRRGFSAKFMTIIRWPAILIAHIQRTRVTGHTVAKNDDFMQFPSRMCAWSQALTVIRAVEILRPEYDLVAVVQHSGALGSGHYTTYRRVIGDDARCRWLHCSDSIVTEVSLDEVLSAQAYLLFYQSATPPTHSVQHR